MSQPPIDWDNYQIPLDPPGGAKPTGPYPPIEKESPRVRPPVTAPPSGRRVLSVLLWCTGGFLVAVACAIGLGYLFETVLYEKLWGPMPTNEAAIARWLDDRVSMSRVATVLGALAGGAFVRLIHGILHRND